MDKLTHVFNLFISIIYMSKNMYCRDLKNSSAKQVLTYKLLLNRNNVVTIMDWPSGKKLKEN